MTPNEILTGALSMDLRRLPAALTASCILITAAPAFAQTIGASHVGPVDPPRTNLTFRPNAPQFRMPEGDLRVVGEPQRNGLIASVPVNRNFEIGVGRFRVSEIARPRTHTENDRNPASMNPRQRSIAGVGFSLRFD